MDTIRKQTSISTNEWKSYHQIDIYPSELDKPLDELIIMLKKYEKQLKEKGCINISCGYDEGYGEWASNFYIQGELPNG